MIIITSMDLAKNTMVSRRRIRRERQHPGVALVLDQHTFWVKKYKHSIFVRTLYDQ